MKRRDWLVLAGFLGLNLVLRLGAFPKTVIDWDESLSLLLGRSLLRGEIPYTTLFEHSPVGTHALFALIQLVFGESVVAIRVATWLVVGIEGFLLYRVGGTLGARGRNAGLLAGLLYAIFTLPNVGLAAHRELFLAPLVTVAVYALLARPGRLSAVLLAGLALGLALQIKYMYIFECAAMALIAVVMASSQRPSPSEQQLLVTLRILRWLKTGLALAVGPLAIMAAVAVWFVLNRHWTEFADANFRSAVTYAASEPRSLATLVARLSWQARNNSPIWMGALLSPFYLALARGVTAMERRKVVGLLAWFGLALLGTLSTGKYWNHYFLQLVAPGSLLMAWLLVDCLADVAHDRLRYGGAITLLLIPALAWFGYPALNDSAQLVGRYVLRGAPPAADGPRIVSNYLAERLRPGEAILVADFEPIVYYLTDARIPTKYAFGPHLTDTSFATEGIDQLGEVRQALDQRPVYVIMQSSRSATFTNQAVAQELTKRLAREYILEQTIPVTDTFTGRATGVELYRLKANP